MINKVLIVDKAHPALTQKFEGAGFCCETNLTLSKEQFHQLEDQYVGLVIRSRFLLDAEAFDSKPHLKFVVRLGAGMESIDLKYADKKGIVCLNTPEGNAPAVAQLCLGLVLNSIRFISDSNIEVQNGLWLREKNKGREVGSLTFGIIGYGNTGRAFCEILKPFSPKILVYDKFKSGFQQDGFEEVSLDYLLEESDLISIHINYLPENHYFMNRSLFLKMKKSPILINSSRGLVVNTEHLLEALDQNLISKANLDVLEFEDVSLKIPSKNLWTEHLIRLTEHKNVVLTPHIGGQTFESELRHAEIAFQKINALDFLK
jgi:D-3-phosphoglycerate dehydrogenase